jgi:hypothetical protein
VFWDVISGREVPESNEFLEIWREWATRVGAKMGAGVIVVVAHCKISQSFSGMFKLVK